MSDIKIFEKEEFGAVRVIMQGNDPWFIAMDIAKALGYENPSRDVQRHCKKVNKINQPTELVAGQSPPRNILIIPETDVYRLIMRSNLPNAGKFQDWVCEEVLPSIRKTGGYSMKLPKNFSEALRELADAVEREEQLKLENSQMKPKADFYDTVTDSETAIDMGQTAKVLNMGIGRNYLFEFLRQQKVLMGNNVPYQSMIDAGYFRVIESTYTKPDGSSHINLKTVVYQKGVDYIRKLLLKFGDQEFHEEASDNFLQ